MKEITASLNIRSERWDIVEAGGIHSRRWGRNQSYDMEGWRVGDAAKTGGMATLTL